MRIVSWSEEDADTASILVITPPQDQIERIRTLQVECGVSTDVVPHVTVKAQPGLTDRSRWVQPLRERLRRHRPFALRFIGVGQFVLGPIVVAQFALALVLGLGQFATGVIAIGQVAAGWYVFALWGAGHHVWTATVQDPQAVAFFRRLGDAVKW